MPSLRLEEDVITFGEPRPPACLYRFEIKDTLPMVEVFAADYDQFMVKCLVCGHSRWISEWQIYLDR